jgi:hypothetical protein
MVDCDCPRCGSTQTRALSVLHQNGVRVSESSTSGLFYYRRALGAHASRTQGRSQTLVSASAAPPVAPTTKFLTGGGVPVVLIVGLMVGGAPGFWVAFGLLVVIAVLGGKSDAKPQAAQQHLWSSSFRCNRCGTVFAVIEDETDEAIATPLARRHQ